MNSPMRLLLVDDERLARKRLTELLSIYDDVTIVGEADSVGTALEKIAGLQPDVLFLDMEMPPGSGMDLFSLLPEDRIPPFVVFVTAYDSFAVRAFEVRAFDYLLKPVHPDRLAITLRRIREMRNGDVASDPSSGSEERWDKRTRVLLGDRQFRKFVEIGSIAAIQAMGAYSRVCLDNGTSVVVLRSISEWDQRLPEDGFARLDRSLIIQPALLTESQKKSRDETVLVFTGYPEAIRIGRIASRRLSEWFGRPLP